MNFFVGILPLKIPLEDTPMASLCARILTYYNILPVFESGYDSKTIFVPFFGAQAIIREQWFMGRVQYLKSLEKYVSPQCKSCTVI